MCRLYKINYLQLHLTDNESFVFPTQAFPALPSVAKGVTAVITRGKSLPTWCFADQRGVTLVPSWKHPATPVCCAKWLPSGGLAWDASTSPTRRPTKRSIH